MSKSSGKYKTIGFAVGNNTEYYRERIKYQRRVNNHRIRDIIANNDIEDFDDILVAYKLPKRDGFREPTDGIYKVYPDEVKNYIGIWKVKGKNKIKK